MRNAIFLSALIIGLLSCKKDKLDINSYWQCNQSQNLDSARISAKIAGIWVWSKQSCSGSGKTKQADRNISVVFNADHTFIVNENAAVLTQGTWNIVQVDGSSCGLNLSSSSEFLFGRILFCENQVLFNDSYRDGCDNLFIRTN